MAARGLPPHAILAIDAPATAMSCAGVAELVDALGLGPSIARCGGSSPFARTSPPRRRGDRPKNYPECSFRQRPEDMQTVETLNEGLKRAYTLTITAEGYRCQGRCRAEARRAADEDARLPSGQGAGQPRAQDARPGADAGRAQRRDPGEASRRSSPSKQLRPAIQPSVELDDGYDLGKDAVVKVALEVLPDVPAPAIDGSSSSA